jgi:polyhydroxyalkanoate synthase
VDWTLYEHLDRLRRQQGALLDALGLGPIEAPYREVYRAPGVSLRRYGSGEESGPLVLIVPAPIKRPYIWDLAPGGRAIAPLADAQGRQILTLVTKQADGAMRREAVCEVLYVALRRSAGEAPSPRAASREPPHPPGSR